MKNRHGIDLHPESVNADCVALLLGFRNDESAGGFRSYWREAAEAGAFNNAQTVGNLAFAYLRHMREVITNGGAADHEASPAV